MHQTTKTIPTLHIKLLGKCTYHGFSNVDMLVLSKCKYMVFVALYTSICYMQAWIWFIGIQIAHSLSPYFSLLPLSKLVVLAWVLPKLTIIPRENKQGTERRYGFGSTFEFGRRVELESLEKPQLQLHLRLLLPYQKQQETISEMITRPLPWEREEEERG